MRLLASFLLLAVYAWGCQSDPPPAAPAPEPFAPTVVEVPTWGTVFAAAGYDTSQATFVLLEPDSQRILRYNAQMAEKGTLPASTFKIVNTLLGIELGPLRGPETTFSFDSLQAAGAYMSGTSRDAVRRDLSLREAFRLSAPWYFQEVARQLGPDQLAAWLDSLDYGNRDMRAGVDRFWLEGGFKISPMQQADFLFRVFTDRTPIACRPQEVLREIALLDSTAHYRLYGKTGWGIPDPGAEPRTHYGWLVGWVELAKKSTTEKQRRVYYAYRVIEQDPLPETWAADRQRLTEQLLRKAGYLPPA